MIRVVNVRYKDGTCECKLTGADEIMFQDKRIEKAIFRRFETMAEAAGYLKRVNGANKRRMAKE